MTPEIDWASLLRSWPAPPHRDRRERQLTCVVS